ncbi:MAG: hypothetical protein QXU98_14480 [Candidatus Parvarchaeota archaeon]
MRAIAMGSTVKYEVYAVRGKINHKVDLPSVARAVRVHLDEQIPSTLTCRLDGLVIQIMATGAWRVLGAATKKKREQVIYKLLKIVDGVGNVERANR